MNTNMTNAAAAIEADGYIEIGERRTRLTRTGRTITDNDTAVLPHVKRFRIDAGRSYMAKGAWTTNYMIFIKLDDGDNHAWRHAANVATEYGMSMPATYATYDKALAAAKKIKATWGEPKAVRTAKPKEPTKAEIAKMTVEEFTAWQALQAAKAAA